MKSKTIFKSLLMMAMLAFVGCETDGTEDNSNPRGGDDDATYTVVVNPPALFQVDGALDDSQGEFELKWASNSKFSVYVNDGEWVDDFAVSDLDNLKFSASSEDTDLSVGVKYIAVYPARQNAEATYSDYVTSRNLKSQTQVGTSADHLLDLVQLSATFYGDEDITFEHNTAILRLSFAEVVGESPKSIVFKYDAQSYTLNFSSMTAGTDINNSYTAYMMIDERDLASGECIEKFIVDYSDDNSNFYSENTSSVNYNAGYIYDHAITAEDTVSSTLSVLMPTDYVGSDGYSVVCDKFSVYGVDDGSWIDDFTVNGSVATAANAATELSANTEYIAVYPARTSEQSYGEYLTSFDILSQSQDGATSNDHLAANCTMSATFMTDGYVEFAYDNAIIEVSLDARADAVVPTKLTLSDGTDTYEVALSNMTGDEYTISLMVEPMAASTNLKYTVVYSGEVADLVEDVTLTDAYSTGNIYTQALTVADPVVPTGKPLELSATIATGAYEGEFSISAWANGDSFVLYDATLSAVDTFTYNDTDSKFKSVKTDIDLDDNTTYTAKYLSSATLSAQSQDGNATTAHLASICQMSATMLGTATTMEFAYDNAIVKVSIPEVADSEPTKLTVANGDATISYELTLTNMTAVEGIYTAYVMVAPTAAETEFTFTAEYSNGAPSESATASFNFAAATLYTQTITAAPVITGRTISNAAELLAYLADPSEDVTLIDNITFDTETIPTPATTLNKIFNGNNKKIINYKFEDETVAAGVGLFQAVGATGVVKNLTIESPTLKGQGYVGAIAGKLNAGGIIQDCVVTEGVISSTAQSVGGLVGQSKGVISGCSFAGSVVGSAANIGGIVGYAAKDGDNACSITNCTSSATISDVAVEPAGGIAGKVTTATVSGCSFDGTLTGVAGSKNIAGIVGSITVSSVVSGCTNRGTITSAAGYFAGVVGSVDGTSQILGCTNRGVVSLTGNNTTGYTAGIVANAMASSIIAGCANTTEVSGNTKVGGIVGYAAGTTIACYNTATITASEKVAGGIAGGGGGAFISCYATGTGTGAGNTGYIIGSAGGTSSYTECYFYGSATTTAAKGTKCTDIQALNTAVDAMNTAIESSECTDYKFAVGTDQTTDLPTIILNEL